MHDVITLDTALCLPAPELQALAEGRVVALLSGFSLTKGEKFALYPSAVTFLDSEIQRCYQPQFWTAAHIAINKAASEPATLRYWVECQGCRIVDTSDELNAISSLGIWQPEFLQSWLSQRQYVILAFFRAYQLSELVIENTVAKVGKFLGLSVPIRVHEKSPVLEESVFRHHLEHTRALKPPIHPELEALESALAQNLGVEDIVAEPLLTDLKQVLFWRCSVPKKRTYNEDSQWINNIAALGERSKELDEGKNNYQAGTDFEIAVRNSLEFLGFKIDYAHHGGAGGLDLSCSEPYLVIGECKSGKKIPNDTAVQLLNLGTLRLENKEAFNGATKLIIGPGTPTTQLQKASLVHGMAIINPHTLERLVKLQHQYPGSIDLIELKSYLIYGRADDEVALYIEQVKSGLYLRSFIVQQIRNYLLDAKAQTANLDSLHAIYIVSNPPKRLSRKEFYDILIELASPFAGYLGRHASADGNDSFYFLRLLTVA
ncbi:MAG: DUF1802 family protein [Cyanobacteria bacterium P01_B01_bin.77]